jgi:hypothetical protein
VIVLYALWNKRSHNTAGRQVYIFYAKMILLSAIIGPLLMGFKTVILKGIDTGTFSGSTLSSVLTATVFVVIMAGVAYGLKIDEITFVAGQLISKLKKTFGYR